MNKQSYIIHKDTCALIPAKEIDYQTKVIESHKLCFFPTHSPNHIDNCWINFDQIMRWGEIPRKKRTSSKQIEVTFKNGVNMKLGVSAHTFNTQFDRAFTLMHESGMLRLHNRKHT